MILHNLHAMLANERIEMLSSKLKHLLHCAVLITLIIKSMLVSTEVPPNASFDPWTDYGVPFTLYLYFLRYLTLLNVPVTILHFLGFVCYNMFPEKVKLQASPLSAPFICVRVVTKGDFPHLVRANVVRNLAICVDAGLSNFQIEVVTDKAMNLPAHKRVRELVVPPTYRTRNGSLFKARALQYCLEDGVNTLTDAEWIVHLDEETLLTEDSIRGILNFVSEGKHSFGQGVISYANEEVVNWVTTLADVRRVADDLGRLRAQFKIFHKPLFSWKGSYVVSQVGAERSVSFDFGPDGSIAEDCFFALKAFEAGYTFDFIEGEMWEKSPFTFSDFLQQRKRWMQGIYLTVHSKAIPLRYKIGVAACFYAWMSVPLVTSNVLLISKFPIQFSPFLDALLKFTGAVNFYANIIGTVKSFSLRRYGIIRCVIFAIGAICTVAFSVVIENVAVVWGLFSSKHRFYVVTKDNRPQVLQV